MPNQPAIKIKNRVFTEPQPPAESSRAQRGNPTLSLTLQQKFLRASSLLTTAYLCAMFLVHPLVFSNFYFNITETKQGFFLIASGVYLLLLLFARIALPPDFGVVREKTRLHPAAVALFALFAVSLVGALISRYTGEAFYGENNRYQGLLTLSCYAFLVFALSRQRIDLVWPERAFLLGACIVSLLGVLHHYGIDPLGFTTNLRESDRGRFLSTIGNADFYAGYLVLAFCVSLGFFLRAKTKRARILSALIFAIVSFGALVAGSDSAALGLLAAAAFAPLLLFSDRVSLRRLPLGWAIFFLCAFVFGLLSTALKSATFLSSFFAVLRRPAVSLTLAAVSLALWLALSRVSQERLSRAKRPYAVTLVCLLLAGGIALALLNTLLRALPLGALERYVHFSESWGTDRGKIWTFVLRVYARLPFAQQLFGGSSGALFHADAANPIFSDAGLDTAHNEYLQYLVTNGALGLICYFASLGFAVWAGLSRSKEDAMSRGLTLAVAAYAVQAVVNIAQPMTTPLFIILVGVLVSRSTQAPSRADNDSL